MKRLSVWPGGLAASEEGAQIWLVFSSASSHPSRRVCVRGELKACHGEGLSEPGSRCLPRPWPVLTQGAWFPPV